MCVPLLIRLPGHRCGLSVSRLLAQPSPTKARYDSVTASVRLLSQRGHFIPSSATDTAVDLTTHFFRHIFSLHGLSDIIVSHRDQRLMPGLWTHPTNIPGITYLIDLFILMLTSSWHQTTSTLAAPSDNAYCFGNTPQVAFSFPTHLFFSLSYHQQSFPCLNEEVVCLFAFLAETSLIATFCLENGNSDTSKLLVLLLSQSDAALSLS